MASSTSGLNEGAVLDEKYVLRERIGEGGMSTVFLAEQPALLRTVAIKILRSDNDSGDIERVHAEAVAACHVRSPHCVAVIDYSVLPDGTPYLVMEYVPGRSLERIITGEPVRLSRAIALFAQVLDALGATHDSGLVHGDVKSDNFMVEQLGIGEHVTMIDFGLAQAAAPPVIGAVAGNAVVLGTPAYMAPEVIRGEPPTRASDLYGAGVILYELLTGTTPFDGENVAVVAARHLYEPVEPPSQRRRDRAISPVFDELVLRALDKRPVARFDDAGAFARELRAAARQARRRSAGRGGRRDGARPPTDRQERAEDLKELRCVIGEALARDDLAQVADGYLAVAQLLRAERRFTAAAQQLEEAIELLTAGRAITADDERAAFDRLKVALAALHEAGVVRHGAAPREPALQDGR